MPIFISYSHVDKVFATTLASQLVAKKHSIWIDSWEINAGDSLISTIQEAIQKASALLVIFSKASIASTWCQKEVIAGIQRELEEKQVVVIPVKIEDCDIPLFLRDKMFADFRTSYDQGLAKVEAAIAKFSNPTMGRIENDDYHTDWSYAFADVVPNGGGTPPFDYNLTFSLVRHSTKWDYSVLTTIEIFSSPEATARFRAYEKVGLREYGHLIMVESFLAALDDDLPILPEDNMPKEYERVVHDPQTNITFAGVINSRRLGNDNGRDILIHGKEEVEQIRDMVREFIKPPAPSQVEEIKKIVATLPKR